MGFHADIRLSTRIIIFILLLSFTLVEIVMLGYQTRSKSQLIGYTRSATPSSAVDLLHSELTDPLEEFKQHSNDLIQSVEQRCQNNRASIFKSYANENPGQFLTDWVWAVFPAFDLFYCAIPKCASTTWKTYFVEATGCAECNSSGKWDPEFVHLQILSNKKLRKIFNVGDKIKKSKLDPFSWISNSSYTNKLMIVRNPWHRLVSAYNNKIVGSQWKVTAFCPGSQKYAHIAKGAATFEQFLECVLQRRSGQLGNAHTHPMADLCGVCHINYSLIVKFEEIHENAEFVGKILDINSTAHHPSESSLKTTNTGNESEVNKYIANYYRQIDKTTIERLKEEYKYDFLLFGYPDSPFKF